MSAAGEAPAISPPALLSAAGGENFCVSEQVYVDSGNEKKVLYLLCIGLTINEQPLFSLDSEPWSILPKTSFVRPKNTDYVREITRRARLFNIAQIPRPSNWTRGRTLEWLQQNPVRELADIDFLTNEVTRVQEVLRRAAQQQVPQQGESSTTTTSGGGRNWRGSVPYLRLIMCLTQDHVKCLLFCQS